MYQNLKRVAFGRKEPPCTQSHSTNLIIVEDQELLAEYMAAVAEDLGWEVETAGSLEAVERLLEGGHPAILVIDLGLPDGDGVELLRHLAQRRYRGAVLIVSSCDDAILESCSRLAEHLDLQVLGWARKPITAVHFASLLNRQPLRSTH